MRTAQRSYRSGIYALVESVRTDAGPRQDVVAYLGELNHDEQRRWQRTVSAYNCQADCQQLRLFPNEEEDRRRAEEEDRRRAGLVAKTNLRGGSRRVLGDG